MKWILSFGFIALASLLAGCASTVFEGRADLAGDFHKQGLIAPTTQTPHLFFETAPEDFALSSDGTVRYDKAKYEYIGKIYVRRNFEQWSLGFVSYNESWRRYYCPPVVTLTYGTAFLLGLTPLPYFCAYETSNSSDRIEERKRNLAYAAIERGMSIGATHIIYATYTGIEHPPGQGQIRQVDNNAAATAVASESLHPYMGLVAQAYRRK